MGSPVCMRPCSLKENLAPTQSHWMHLDAAVNILNVGLIKAWDASKLTFLGSAAADDLLKGDLFVAAL